MFRAYITSEEGSILLWPLFRYSHRKLIFVSKIISFDDLCHFKCINYIIYFRVCCKYQCPAWISPQISEQRPQTEKRLKMQNRDKTNIRSYFAGHPGTGDATPVCCSQVVESVVTLALVHNSGHSLGLLPHELRKFLIKLGTQHAIVNSCDSVYFNANDTVVSVICCTKSR